jgi:hypothetical protein
MAEVNDSEIALKHRVALRLLIGAALLFLLLAAGYVFFVLTTPGQALDNTAFAGRPTFSSEMKTFDADILREVNKRDIIIAMGGLFILSLAVRRPLVGVVVVLTMGVAIFGAEFFKHTLPRPLLSPADIPVPAYFATDTYPSGHTSVGTSVALGLLLIGGPLLRPWLGMVAGLVSASFATGVYFMGWHRPSDAIGGILWCGVCFSLAAAALVMVHGHSAPKVKPFRGAINAMLAGGLIVGMAILVPLRTGNLDFSFFVLSAAIIAAAFALPVYLVSALARMDWRSGQRRELE